jgi:hypothetical protein
MGRWSPRSGWISTLQCWVVCAQSGAWLSLVLTAIRETLWFLLEPQLTLTAYSHTLRFAMVVEDNVVKHLELEPDNTGISCTMPDKMLTKL